jgi:hypothetical protein
MKCEAVATGGEFKCERCHALWFGELAKTDWRPGACKHAYQRPERKAWIEFPSALRVGGDFLFRAYYSPNGRKSLIVTGCRTFTIPQAKAHWRSRERDCTPDENDKLNKWSLAYVAKLEAHLRLVRAGTAK